MEQILKDLCNLNKRIKKKQTRINQDIKLFISIGHLTRLKDPLTVIKAF